MPRNPPETICGVTVGKVRTSASIWFPIAAVTEGAPPVKGTCTGLSFATSRKKYSAPICDHDGLPKPLGELLPHQTRDHVGNPAGRESNHDSDVLRRIGLRGGALHQSGTNQGRQQGGARRGSQDGHG